MSMVMDEEFKRWTAKRKAALVTEIIQGKTTVAEANGYLTSIPLTKSFLGIGDDELQVWSFSPPESVTRVQSGKLEAFQITANEKKADGCGCRCRNSFLFLRTISS